MSAALISIIGPPAVGKTTLAALLAAKLPAELIREDYAGNPFLADSYAGSEQARLPGQLYFLLSRVGQLRQGDREAIAETRGLVVHLGVRIVGEHVEERPLARQGDEMAWL